MYFALGAAGSTCDRLLLLDASSLPASSSMPSLRCALRFLLGLKLPAAGCSSCPLFKLGGLLIDSVVTVFADDDEDLSVVGFFELSEFSCASLSFFWWFGERWWPVHRDSDLSCKLQTRQTRRPVVEYVTWGWEMRREVCCSLRRALTSAIV